MRIQGWESRLNDHITAAHGSLFEWGRNDCALWCAEWVRIATGRDLVSDWIGRYHTEREAMEFMKQRGFLTPADIADAHLTPVTLAHAQRGDILLHPQGALGICNGIHGFFLTGRGVLSLATWDCPKAWVVD